MPGTDNSAAGITAARQMSDSIASYNSKVPRKAWRIQGRSQTALIALCQATPAALSMLEDHYSAVCHTEGALAFDQLGYCDLSVGTSRIPNDMPAAPPIWKKIMEVSPEAVEEFAWNLACRQALGRTRVCYVQHNVGRQPNP